MNEITYTQLLNEVKSKKYFCWLQKDAVPQIDNDYGSVADLIATNISKGDEESDAALFVMRAGTQNANKKVKIALSREEQNKNKIQAAVASCTLSRQLHFEGLWTEISDRYKDKKSLIREQCLAAINTELYYMKRSSPVEKAELRALNKKAKIEGIKPGTSVITYELKPGETWPPALSKKNYIPLLSAGLQDKVGSVRYEAAELLPLLAGEFRLDVTELALFVEPLLMAKNSKQLQAGITAAESILLQKHKHQGLFRGLVNLIDHSNQKIQSAAWKALRPSIKLGMLDEKTIQSMLKRISDGNRYADVNKLFFSQEILTQYPDRTTEIIESLVNAIEVGSFTKYVARQFGKLVVDNAEQVPDLLPRIESVLRNKTLLQEANKIKQLRK